MQPSCISFSPFVLRKKLLRLLYALVDHCVTLLGSIPLYGTITICQSSCWLTECYYFPIWVIMNKITKILVHKYSCWHILIYFMLILRNELLGCRVDKYLILLKNRQTVLQNSFCGLNNNIWKFQLFHILLCLFTCHYNSYGNKSYCFFHFKLCFPDHKCVELLLMYLCFHVNILFFELSTGINYPFKKNWVNHHFII